MLSELAIRFAAGGALVALFAVMGDIFTPKSFAGLFAAAPSVALATMVLTVQKHGRAYASTEARSMIIGAIAFAAYASTVSWLLHRGRRSPTVLAVAALALWAAVAAAGWALFLRPL